MRMPPLLTLALAALMAAAAAHAQPSEPPAESPSIFDEIAEGLRRVGEKTQEIISPRFTPLGEYDVVDFTGMVQVQRAFEEALPSGPAPRLLVEHRLGEVRVTGWDNPVIRVRADIAAGAGGMDVAREIANSVNVAVRERNGGVSVRTSYPDTRDRGPVAIEVNLEVQVPRGAQVVCRNAFGDVFVGGIDGAVAVESRFGAVTLEALGGRVQVHARGELPLAARDLRAGGAFVLRGSDAEFREVDGVLTVSNFLGDVRLFEPGAALEAELTCDTGSVEVVLGEGPAPDIEVAVWLGSLQSDIPLAPDTVGGVTTGRSAHPESSLRLALQASFGDVVVRRSNGAEANETPRADAGERAWVKRVLEPVRTLLPGGAPVHVDAAAGAVEVYVAEGDALEVNAVQHVELASGADPDAAFEALDVRVEERDGQVHLIAAADAAALEGLAGSHRIDLRVGCPAGSPVKVYARQGETRVAGLSAAVDVVQEAGQVTLVTCTGPATVMNHDGGVEAEACAGPLTLQALNGPVTTRGVYGPQTVEAGGGKTVVDAPGGPVTVRQRGGDVRLIPLDGVQGDFEVIVTDGNVSMLVPREPGAAILAHARGGVVRTSSLALSGEIGSGYQRFQTVPDPAVPSPHRVTLTTKGGDIFID